MCRRRKRIACYKNVRQLRLVRNAAAQNNDLNLIDRSGVHCNEILLVKYVLVRASVRGSVYIW